MRRLLATAALAVLASCAPAAVSSDYPLEITPSPAPAIDHGMTEAEIEAVSDCVLLEQIEATFRDLAEDTTTDDRTLYKSKTESAQTRQHEVC
jgi:hypothetical protein